MTGKPNDRFNFRQFVTLPEITKTTINIYGSTNALKKALNSAREEKEFVIHPYSSFRKYWLVIVMLVTFANVIVVPLSVSFFTQEVHFNPTWISLNAVVDVLFIMDLCLNFRIGYRSEEMNDVVLETKKIRNHYLKTWFFPDLIAVLPVDYLILIIRNFVPHPNAFGVAGVRMVKLIKLTRLFSLLRLLRFSRLLRYTRKWEEVHGWNVGAIATFLQFLHMVVIIIFICHWSACFHFLVAVIGEFPENSWITQEGLQNKSLPLQYTRCMFRSLCHMMTLNYGSTRAPKGILQLWVDIISMMVGTVMYALLLARITALVTNSRASENVYNQKKNELKQYMQLSRIPLDLRLKALDHLYSRYQGMWFDERAILMDLNEPLRQDLIHYNCSLLIQRHPIFRDADPIFLTEVLEMLEFEYYLEGELIIQRGAVGDCMFFIEKGQVQVETPDFTEILTDGSFFGELCMVTDKSKRQANVRALTACRLYSLSASKYKKILEQFPDGLRKITNEAEKRQETLNS